MNESLHHDDSCSAVEVVVNKFSDEPEKAPSAISGASWLAVRDKLKLAHMVKSVDGQSEASDFDSQAEDFDDDVERPVDNEKSETSRKSTSHLMIQALSFVFSNNFIDELNTIFGRNLLNKFERDINIKFSVA